MCTYQSQVVALVAPTNLAPTQLAKAFVSLGAKKQTKFGQTMAGRIAASRHCTPGGPCTMSRAAAMNRYTVLSPYGSAWSRASAVWAARGERADGIDRHDPRQSGMEQTIQYCTTKREPRHLLFAACFPAGPRNGRVGLAGRVCHHLRSVTLYQARPGRGQGQELQSPPSRAGIPDLIVDLHKPSATGTKAGTQRVPGGLIQPAKAGFVLIARPFTGWAALL